MFQPLPLFVGLRYVRARRHAFFVSFITWVSLLGVALGVAALIVVLSVMNGFEAETRTRLLSLSAHAHVQLPGAATSAAADQLAQRLRRMPQVAGAAAYMELQALAVRQPEILPVTVRGIEPAADGEVMNVAPMLRQGNLADLAPGAGRVILGNELANRLGVAVGDTLSLLVPVIDANDLPVPRLREFTVSGLFSAGISDHDSALLLMHLDDARALAPELRSAMGVQLRYRDALRAGALLESVRASLPPGASARDWTTDNASYLRAVRIEKSMMALILMLVVAVAAFSIVAMLVMVVNEKRTDTAILRTLGAAPSSVAGALLTQGLVIGWLGVLAGVALGVFVANEAGTIVALLERLFHFRLFDADVYYISELPSELQAAQVWWVAAAALCLTLLATLYPAQRAAQVPPAEALRYE